MDGVSPACRPPSAIDDDTFVIRFIERKFVYPAPSAAIGDWTPRWIENEEVEFASADGARLHGWFVPHPNPRHVILYSHGNSEHVGLQVNTLLRLQATLDATVFVYDYRGYGRSRGKPNERGVIADCRAAHDWLAHRVGLPFEQIVLMGRSLGGGVSVAVAAERGCQALVIDATFSRMVDAASYNYPWLPVKTMMRDRYDSLARIVNYHGPLFQSHRATDEVVPVALARQVTERSPSKLKQFYEIPHGRHNEPLPPDYYSALATFLDKAADRSRPAVTPALPLANGQAVGMSHAS